MRGANQDKMPLPRQRLYEQLKRRYLMMADSVFDKTSIECLAKRLREVREMPGRSKQDYQNGSLADNQWLARLLAEAGRGFSRRGWVLGTSGNFFSAVGSSDPLCLRSLPAELTRGRYYPETFLEIDANGEVTVAKAGLRMRPASSRSRASARGGRRHASHSVWSTLLSEAFARDGNYASRGLRC